MSFLAKMTLMMVVFVDLLGQGLVFPIINAMIMDTSGTFLPGSTSMATRHFDYGLVIGVFFLSWFIGCVYVARMSDSIGRKNAMLVCLFGALAGYALTILALWLNSLLLLIVGRAITGFTAGNQPIAQAAMIDGSKSDAERDQNFGYLMIGVSAGLLGGPIIGAVFSDKSLLGGIATYSLPFYIAGALVIITIVLVLLFFRDIRTERAPFHFRPWDIVANFLKIGEYPVVMKMMTVYVLFHICNVTFYVFIDNYLTSAFSYGIIGTSIAMFVIGVAIAFSGTYLVGPMQKRFDKFTIVAICMGVFALGPLVFSFLPGPVTYLPVFLTYLIFGFTYPTFLGLFSGSVAQEDQGWIMGITTCVFCLAGGIMSLIGGGLMAVDIRLPFYLASASGLLAFIAVFLTWNAPVIRKLTAKPDPDPVTEEI